MKIKKEKQKLTIKQIIIRIIIVIAILLGLFILIGALPFIVFACSMIWNMFFVYPDKPIEKHGEFPFELIYEYKGEQKTIKDTIICDYDGYSYAIETGNTNDWKCYFKDNDENYGQYYIDQENEPELSIIIPDAPDYYMGEKDSSKEFAEPGINYYHESTGTYYSGEKAIDVIDIKIIKWEPSEPLKNNFK